MWTDKDRAKKRTYLIFVGRKLKEKVQANLSEATELWNKVCSDNSDDDCITLYHDKRAIENECCKQF